MMKKTMIMPQEVEVWYLLPALRRELANIFLKDYAINQRRISKMLGITESAVSQYLSSKRASELIFSLKERKKIKEAAKKIINKKQSVMKTLYNLSAFFMKSKVMCNFHKEHDKNIPKNCQVCFK
ncbi:hypothetical protein J4225_05225 [Candidatus Pacearchaeota archaeon]|nr:hypothetical protein [Candidatus Pacearchaeota archaeon]